MISYDTHAEKLHLIKYIVYIYIHNNKFPMISLRFPSLKPAQENLNPSYDCLPKAFPHYFSKKNWPH